MQLFLKVIFAYKFKVNKWENSGINIPFFSPYVKYPCQLQYIFAVFDVLCHGVD